MAALKEQLRDTLAAGGMRETITYSATSLATLEKVDALDGGPEPIRLANPMSGDLEYLKTSLRGSILETLASNRRISQSGPMRLFEIGRVYLQKEEAKERELPEEREMLVGVLSGRRFPVSWQAPEGDLGFFDAKGMLEEMFAVVGVSVAYEAGADSVLHPGRTARLTCTGAPIGVVGEVDPRVLGRFDVDVGVAMFELDVEALCGAVGKEAGGFAGVSRFPESERDCALVVDESVPSARIQKIIRQHKLVVRAAPFDVYSGEAVPAGKKSIAYRIAFQSPAGTLTTAEVDRAQGDILRRLGREVGAELRA
jgi:phenylalanyl-tRNA synthetase beta chain